MPTLFDYANFDRRLWVAANDRTAAPEGSLRRCKGVAPELTGSIRSMYPPQLLYANIAALNLTRFQNHRYQFDGTRLYKDGVAIYSGGNGNRATFVAMPPASGLTDSLFMAGSGPLIKVDAAGNVTNWGIQEPPDSLQVINNPQEEVVIDNFDASASSYTIKSGITSLTDDAGNFVQGTASLLVNPSSGDWSIQRNYGAAVNLGNYAGTGDFVLPTDLFQFWIYLTAFPTTNPGWTLEIDFDINDQTFKKDWYSIVLAMIPSFATVPRIGPGATIDVTFQIEQWQQVTVAKSQFIRHGSTTQLDWTMVQAIRIKAANFTGSGNINLDFMRMAGGAPLGTGPAAGLGGSEYDYYVTFENLTTGNQSNAQPDKAAVFGVACNTTSLAQIPVSTDSQVDARVLYRTTENGGTPFYLDTIYDNVTTTYTDRIGDFSVPFTTTPWTANIPVPPLTPPMFGSNGRYYIDPGNGFYFRLTTNGTTGATQPNWKVPTSTWVALGQFFANTTIAPPQANGTFFIVTTAGISGATQPDWAAHLPVGSTVTDGSVVWTSLDGQTTTDGGAVWTFQGINSCRTLGTQALQFDNTVPPATIQDAVGPYQGSMVWTRDTATGAMGRVYISPPGRAESVGIFVDVGTDDEPAQKAIVFQNTLWVLTTRRVFRAVGTYPQITFVPAYTEEGTQLPFTVSFSDRDVFFAGDDGIRAFNWGSSRLYAFDPIAVLQRGYSAEDMPAFDPVVAGLGRDEVFFSDGVSATFAVGHDRPFWRFFDVGMTAIYNEDETGEIIVSYNGNVYLWEHQSFSGAPIAFNWEVQTPAQRSPMNHQAMSQRLYLDIDTAGQVVVPILNVDAADIVLPSLTSTSRQLFELPYHYPGKVYSVRLTATPQTGTIELFRAALDVA